MKNTFMILVVSLLFVGCKQDIKPADVARLNGYWEIEKVVFEKGEEKDYGMNEDFDFIEVKGDKGTRTKLKVQLDGSFLTTDTFENFSVRITDKGTFLDYKTNFAKWSEELIAVSDDKFVVINDQHKEYHYKKAQPVNLLNDGKEIK
jgi:phage anti-repressor protein